MLEDISLGKKLPLLRRGTHSIAIDAKFGGVGVRVLKGTVKLEAGVKLIKK